jgi:hypothetical protein
MSKPRKPTSFCVGRPRREMIEVFPSGVIYQWDCLHELGIEDLKRLVKWLERYIAWAEGTDAKARTY